MKMVLDLRVQHHDNGSEHITDIQRDQIIKITQSQDIYGYKRMRSTAEIMLFPTAVTSDTAI